MAARRDIQHFSSSVRKHFTLSLFLQHGKRNFVSLKGHVQSCNVLFFKIILIIILITRNKCYM